MKTAILQVADTGPLESLVVMLRAVGYQCYLPSESLKVLLRSLGCDMVLEISNLMRGMGYSRPLALPDAPPEMMETCDLYVDVKGHRNGPRVWRRWPRLQQHTLWYRINGGRPEHVVNARGDHGDEVNPPCPVLTPNQWYTVRVQCQFCGEAQRSEFDACMKCGRESYEMTTPWNGRAYTCWPPFYRYDEYHWQQRQTREEYVNPICLIHNFAEWGYGALTTPLRSLGLRIYGAGSPDGLIQHREVKSVLESALCMIHLKSNDAPGYAIYECLAAACPLVCTRRLIWRCRMEDLLIPGETCLVFDRETHEELTPEDVKSCTAEVRQYLERLRDPAENRRIGLAGRERLKELMWSEGRSEDTSSLAQFLNSHFGG